MPETVIIGDSRDEGERRRVERRRNARVGDLTLPELRRILITTTLGAVVLMLFLWMVRAVVIAAILGLIIGFYIRPLHLWILKRTQAVRKGHAHGKSQRHQQGCAEYELYRQHSSHPKL